MTASRKRTISERGVDRDEQGGSLGFWPEADCPGHPNKPLRNAWRKPRSIPTLSAFYSVLALACRRLLLSGGHPLLAKIRRDTSQDQPAFNRDGLKAEKVDQF